MDFFIGIDSDGTVFDTMVIKHNKAFIPMAIKIWNLEGIEKEYYEVAEYVNLHSNLRGINRFPGLLLIFEYLDERQDVKASGVRLPDYSGLKEFVNSDLPMSFNSLKGFTATKKSKFLSELMEWSLGGDELFSKYANGLKPFEYVRESLILANKYADLMIISSATTNGLKKDWSEGGILKYISKVSGQEDGSKQQQLNEATLGKYYKNRILIIGDALGDLKAAKASDALFFPINYGDEAQSWKRFYYEALNRFLNGTYAGAYEDSIVDEFMRFLSDKKPWV
jgi:phosphoglycolate phosphatase-like HAD superfamily hydrolase